MYLDFGKVRVHVSFPFAAVLAYALNTGRGEGLLTLFVCALLHECAHAVFLLGFGCRGLTLELRPGGARLKSEGAQRMSARQTLCAVLAGPAVNLLLAAALFVCRTLRPSFVFDAGVRVNLLLGGLNLLPISFLDGGRALDCLFLLVAGRPAPPGLAAAADLAVTSLLGLMCAYLFACGRDAFYLALFTAYCIAAAFGKT